jgi:hypothetical protein
MTLSHPLEIRVDQAASLYSPRGVCLLGRSYGRSLNAETKKHDLPSENPTLWDS